MLPPAHFLIFDVTFSPFSFDFLPCFLCRFSLLPLADFLRHDAAPIVTMLLRVLLCCLSAIFLRRFLSAPFAIFRHAAVSCRAELRRC